MAVNLDSVKDALTHKYGPLPGYAWAGLGAAAIVVIASRRKSASGSSTPAFLTTPPQSAIAGNGGFGAGGAGNVDPALGFGEPNVTPADVSTPTPFVGGQPNSPTSSPTLETPAAIITAEPLPALAPFADQLVARGIDPSTGGLLPGAGNSSGVPGSPIAYGPGLYDSTPTIATTAGPIAGGVFRADPTEFAPGPASPQNAPAVIEPVLAAPAPAAPPQESLIAMHYRLGRDTINV